MKRRWFVVLGAFFLISQGVVYAAFGFPMLDTKAALSLISWMFVGVLFILGGLSVRIGNIEWYQFVGAADVFMGTAFGLDFSLPLLGDGSAAELILAVVGVVGGLSMIFIGVDWIRGGHHFDISQYETGPILAFMNRNET